MTPLVSSNPFQPISSIPKATNLQEPPNAAPNRVVSTKEASFFLKSFLKSFSTSCPHP
jgi:hypothetical protein